MISTVPGWVEVAVLEVVVSLVVDVLVDVRVEVVLPTEDEELLADVVLVVEEALVEELEIVAEVDDGGWVEVEPKDALLIDVLSPADEEVEGPICVDVEGCVLLVVGISDAGWRNTSAASVPARRMRVIPAISATVENRPQRPADFLACIVSIIVGRVRALSACA